ncbi:MAG: hypothetical protein AB1422_17275 [bacterium]
MHFDEKDISETQYKETRTCRCEECGYMWVQEVRDENGFGEFEEEQISSCPMCGGSYLAQM